MMYQAFDASAQVMDRLRAAASALVPFLDVRWPTADCAPLDPLAAACEVFANTALTYHRPDFGIHSIDRHGVPVDVTEHVAYSTPFCDLLRFQTEGLRDAPKVLLVAPMSGHFATLLRGTVRTLLIDHDVFITDWKSARHIPWRDGRFGLEEYVQHLIWFLQVLGEGAHVIAVCQPTVATLAAVALMAADGDSAQPSTMTLMAGPIDARINPTEVNRMATSHSIDWFESHLISRVPLQYGGAFRRVYPGFLQIGAFMSMNPDRHAKAFRDLFTHLVDGDDEKANVIKAFYAEYFATADLTAEFYLETVEHIFHEYALARGVLQFHGEAIDVRAIRRTALLTIEGEKDDVCALGQTVAAHDLCTGLRSYMKEHHIQTGVGHYGVFNGRRWDSAIYPRVRNFIHSFH